MVTIRRVTRSTELSNFRQGGPRGGEGFAAIADIANAAYDYLAPLAAEGLAQAGDAAGRDWAQRALGTNRVSAPSPPSGFTPTPYTAPAAEPGISTTRLLPASIGAAVDRVTAPRVSGPAGGPVPQETGSATLQGNPGADRLNAPPDWERIRNGIFAGESNGDYNALFGFSNRPGGAFSNVRLTDMTVRDAIAFSDPRGPYANWVRGQVGRVATPMGAYQVVGTTLRAAAEGLGLTGDERMDQAMQDRIGLWIYENQGTGAWEGYRGPRDTAPAGGGGSAALAGGAAADSIAPTLIRTADGSIEARLFPPNSGPVLQAYNAAFQTAALAEATMTMRADMLNLSAQFALDPDGFLAAGRQYVDGIVEQADPMLMRHLRAEAEELLGQRHLGIVDERNRDTVRRAEASSSALIEQYSRDYSNALAIGDARAAEHNLGQLDGLLRAREAIPGLSWVPEQSAGVIMAAQDQAARIRADAQTQQVQQWRGSLETIIAARRDGMTGADEAILQDPSVWQALPDLAEEAAAWSAFGQAMPGFNALPPAAQAETIARMRAEPVRDTYQVRMMETAESAAAASARAWTNDPIAQAEAVLPFKPPPLPPFDPDNPEAFAAAAQARAEYGRMLVAEGYVRTPVFLSREEADMIAMAMDADMPAEARLAAATLVTRTFGPDAQSVFRQIGQNDPVIRFAGQLAEFQGNAGTALDALRGQTAIEQGTAAAPTRLALPEDVAPALAHLPQEYTGNVSQVARAIIAARFNTAEPTRDQIDEAVQAALGQSQRPDGTTVGGVQEVMGGTVFLPPELNGAEIEARIRETTGYNRTIMGRLPNLGFTQAATPRDMTPWVRASTFDGLPGSVPYFAGEPLPPEGFEMAEILPRSDGLYIMAINGIPVERETGGAFIFSMERFMQ